MDVGIHTRHFQEALSRLERSQFVVLTTVFASLLITWKVKWSEAGQLEPLKVLGLPVPISQGLALLLLLVTFFVSSFMSAFYARRARDLARDIAKANPEVGRSLLTYPSLSVHKKRWIRCLKPIVIFLLLVATLALESRWEGSETPQALWKGLVVAVFLILPQAPVVKALLDKSWPLADDDLQSSSVT